MMKAAVIGVGNMGKNHVRVYSEIAQLVAVADLDEKKGKELAERFNCRYYRDYREMLQKEEIDVVSIAVPSIFNRVIAFDVIHAGKPFLLEKPIADTLQNARDIIEEAERCNVRFMVGHIERFNPAVLKMKEIVNRKELGEVTSLVAKRVGVMPANFRSSNVVIDLAVHDIDIFNYLLDDIPLKVTGNSGTALVNSDYADLLLRYGKTNAFIQVNWITPIKIRQLCVTGSEGYAELDYITQEINIYRSNFKRDYDTFGDFVIQFNPTKETIALKKQEPLKVELQTFLDCVNEQKPFPVTGGQAYQA